ncbi:MAG: thymidine phosphorylase [Candidatus Eisenbacteria bacterium]
MSLDPRAFVRAKRDGGTHAPDDIRAFIGAYTARRVPDYQASAWLMAAFLNGLDPAETAALTGALIDSGRVFDWSAIGRPSADKHSTGGVGDKISLILAPLVAACDVLVPMVSGRGLGHTGGTLDKLESIPGFRTTLDPEAMRAQLDRIGVVMVGQGPDLAPADGLLYALRDVTATVEFEPFIVSSIVSKKIAEGAGALVYDVKCGNGAFMRTPADARHLAQRLVDTTRAMGRAARAMVTDMSQPLGRACGNALEVRESIAVLQGGGPADVRGLTLDLAARMIALAGVEPTVDRARERATRTLDTGTAYDRFVAMVEAQGGRGADVAARDRLARAPVVTRVTTPRAGTLAVVDTFALGELLVSIGAGRRAMEDAIDPAVGLEVLARVGDRLAKGAPLAELHLAGPDAGIAERCASCFTIGDEPVPAPALTLATID